MIIIINVVVVMLLEPGRENLEGFHVGSVMGLSEVEESGPSEIWIYSWVLSVHQLHGWAYHFIISWTQKECQRFPCCLAVHHRSVQATLVSPI